ncbi:MAG: DUF2235 domain-containing protein, partial [Rhodothermales bacterium]
SAKLSGEAKVLYVLRQEMRGDTPVITVSPEPPQFGVFFDGTGNDMQNALADSKDDDAPTNVAKLFKLYRTDADSPLGAHYNDGVGTHPGESNSKVDMGIAYSFGRRVRRAIEESRQFFKHTPLAKEGVIDVFGFSRGSASARAFVNEVMKLNETDPDYWGGARIKVRFLGLFDTVGSVGVPGDDDNNNVFAATGLDGPIVIDVAADSVGCAYQLTAGDEQRENFPLSSLRRAPEASLPDDWDEIELPGAHSDIGGGYGPVAHTIYFPVEIVMWRTEQQREAHVADLKARYEQRYAAPGIDLDMSRCSPLPNQGPVKQTIVAPVWTRKVNPHLSNYALELMHKKALERRVPLQPLKALPRVDSRFSRDDYLVTTHMRELVDKVRSAGRKDPAYEELYREYIHHSHQYTAQPPKEAMDYLWNLLGNPYAPEEDADHPASNGVRAVYYNDPDAAYSPDDQWERRNYGHGVYRWERMR